jgi:undecaprenyl pyrophosphate synthase
MNKLKLVTGVILVFLVGALAGSIGTEMYFRHRMERFPPGGPPPPVRTALLMKRLSDELNLTNAQRIEIKKIVEESEAKMFAIRRQYLPEIKETIDQSFALMKDKLNADQKEKLEKLHEKIKNGHAKAFIHSVLTEGTSQQILSKMKQRLNLTEDQEMKVRPIIEGAVGERRRMVEKYKEQDHPDIFSLTGEMHKLQEATEKRLAEILTDQQMEQYREIQEEEHLQMCRERQKHGLGGFD